ncbi:hypothetical protein C8R45DRAFT_943465 [Mycena sanguinolenta]|nr:hypothetical protein C8R45DRAFT_943465 [Mycena sanguinolenta]
MPLQRAPWTCGLLTSTRLWCTLWPSESTTSLASRAIRVAHRAPSRRRLSNLNTLRQVLVPVIHNHLPRSLAWLDMQCCARHEGRLLMLYIYCRFGVAHAPIGAMLHVGGGLGMQLLAAWVHG